MFQTRIFKAIAAGNHARFMLIGMCLSAVSGGCASYQPAAIKGLGDERTSSHSASGAQSEEIEVSLVRADVGDMVRVTLQPQQTICGRIDELIDNAIVLISAYGGGQSRIIVDVAEIDRLEVLSSSRTRHALGVMAAILAAAMVWVVSTSPLFPD